MIISARKILAISLVFSLFALRVFFGGSGEGIHFREGSDSVVYLELEGCTVDMTLDRSLEEIQSDMDWCMEKHVGLLEIVSDEYSEVDND